MKISEVEYEQRTRNVAVSDDEFFQNLPTIKLALDRAISGLCRIYRGAAVKSSGVQYVEPAKFKRRSANTMNYYTEIVDNSDRWSMYPKRSQSLICSTDLATAYGYGTVYVVLPQGNPVIGICPAGDWWHSFPQLEPVLGPGGGPADLNSVLRYIYWTLTHNELRETPSYTELVDALQAIDTLNPYWQGRRTDSTTSGIDLFRGAQAWKDGMANRLLKLGGNMLHTCDQLLDPAKNNFSARQLSGLQFPAEHEVWLSAPSYIVPVDKFRYWQESGQLKIQATAQPAMSK